jgi:hypothetical protein
MGRLIRAAVLAGLAVASAQAQSTHEISVSGTRFLLNGKPFPFTGISFFNAIYNPAFNKSAEDRRKWLEKFQRYGINVLRLWAQWDNARGFVDACRECSLYLPDGRLRAERVATLKQILASADELGMVIELALFSHESWSENIRITGEAADNAVASITAELKPYRNLVIQIWNEHSDRVPDHVKTVKSVDKLRLVTNSPGFAGVLGDIAQNNALDFLTPHTTRQTGGKTWDIAPREIAYLLARFRKPVVDDEPARNGTPKFGGPRAATTPFDHMVQIARVWELGGYIVYHHDMFQTGYGTPAVPPSGIPDPDFNPYHRAVLEFIAHRDRYMPAPR